VLYSAQYLVSENIILYIKIPKRRPPLITCHWVTKYQWLYLYSI